MANDLRAPNPQNLAGLSHPRNATAVTPHDTNELASPGILWVGVAGDVKVTTVGGQTVTFTTPSNGFILPVAVKLVFSTGTTATSIIALY